MSGQISYFIFKVTRQVESYILLNKFGVPPACGPLLQLATAEERPGELPKLIAKEYRTQPDVSPCTVLLGY